jgi:NADPH:quinone reductase-like Zn-dependent oxidoreductase
MKAIVYTEFGSSDVIKLIETEKPTIKDDEVLIKSFAVSVNPADIKYRKGLMQQRLPVQLPYIPGLDVAGTIIAIGKNVSRFKVGDKVFGGKHGNTYAEYVTLKENDTSIIPSNVGFNEAAALVVPLVTSYSFLIENGAVQKGQRLFIQGITGGTGQIMLQMAKSLGLYVIGTASSSGIELVKSLGADEVIDYKKNDFTTLVKDIDIVIDLVGGETQINSFKTLKKGGKLFSGAMPPSQDLAKEYEVEAKFIASAYSFKKLDYGRQLVEEGKIKPQIITTMKLDEAAEAQDLLSKGGINGKIVLEIN